MESTAETQEKQAEGCPVDDFAGALLGYLEKESKRRQGREESTNEFVMALDRDLESGKPNEILPLFETIGKAVETLPSRLFHIRVALVKDDNMVTIRHLQIDTVSQDGMETLALKKMLDQRA